MWGWSVDGSVAADTIGRNSEGTTGAREVGHRVWSRAGVQKQGAAAMYHRVLVEDDAS